MTQRSISNTIRAFALGAAVTVAFAARARPNQPPRQAPPCRSISSSSARGCRTTRADRPNTSSSPTMGLRPSEQSTNRSRHRRTWIST